jgi:hypothetical protein
MEPTPIAPELASRGMRGALSMSGMLVWGGMAGLNAVGEQHSAYVAPMEPQAAGGTPATTFSFAQPDMQPP